MTKKRKTDPKRLQGAIEHYSVSRVPNVRKSSNKFGLGYEVLRLALIKAGYSTARAKKLDRSSPIVTENANKSWHLDEDVILRDAVESGTTVRETCHVLGRTPSSIYARKCRLIETGFIKDSSSRFPKPGGYITKRSKKIDDVKIPSSVEVSPELSVTPEKSQGVDLNSLASLVKQFGISVKVSLNPNGTQVDMIP